jgi:Skp family chaperone for outer membrane proteins
MAIAPIDLQTLFTQLDKVGKTHTNLKEGLQQVVQEIQIQKKTEEHIQEVNEAQNTGEGVEKVKDREHGNDQKQNESKKNKKENKEDEDAVSVLSDPSLGRKINISL